MLILLDLWLCLRNFSLNFTARFWWCVRIHSLMQRVIIVGLLYWQFHLDYSTDFLLDVREFSYTGVQALTTEFLVIGHETFKIHNSFCTQPWLHFWRTCHFLRSELITFKVLPFSADSIIHSKFLFAVTFYRAMHFSAKRGNAIACRLSVRPSVCDVGELWSHRLEFFKNNFTVS